MRGVVGGAALTLVVGAAGGLLFYWLRLPLPWMLGAMVANTIAALGGAPVRLPNSFRALCIVVIGVMLGSAFTPGLAARVPDWIGGIAVLAVYAPLATIAGYLYFRRVGGFSVPDAYFASAPGGLNEMVLVGEAMGGDPRRIALVHATRILIVVFTVPFYFRYFSGQYSEAARVAADHLPLGLQDALILTTAGIVGALLGRVARVPASQLLGPMAISAAVHLTGVTSSRPPVELVAVAQIVMGSTIGCRFSGARLHEIRRVILIGAGSAFLLLTGTAGFTLAFQDLVDVPAEALALSLAPGGVTEMSLVALALAVDAAYVSCLHIIRIAMVVSVAPLAFRLGAKRKT
ncbi:AbrB family transcriptional regulator [Desertibaculum subflavum]|uniref:AbrB family transcriptional regulator n=1 Tax=Desertibaculum subflavum TaxID=2268458 RepID=UPI0013C514FE